MGSIPRVSFCQPHLRAQYTSQNASCSVEICFDALYMSAMIITVWDCDFGAPMSKSTPVGVACPAAATLLTSPPRRPRRPTMGRWTAHAQGSPSRPRARGKGCRSSSWAWGVVLGRGAGEGPQGGRGRPRGGPALGRPRPRRSSPPIALILSAGVRGSRARTLGPKNIPSVPTLKTV
jgi:hypothetical protein